jgi:hypothetical protein
VLKKAAEKLFARESHRPFLVVILVIPPTEADLGFVDRKKPVIGDGHAMRITGQTAVTLTEIVHGVSMETGNPLSLEARVDLGARLAGEVFGAGVAGRGKEWAFSKDTRFAPFGNRSGNKKGGELPHYHAGHRLKSNDPLAAGQSYKRHRPWESRPEDRTWCDRFWPPKRWPRK